MATTAVRTVRTIFWSDAHRRARVPWLILVPLVGAFMATSADTLVPFELPLPVASLLASGAPAVVAVLLVVLSRRFLGGRRLVDYGLAIDRRWMVDLTAGLVVGLLAVSIPFMVAIGAGWAEIVATFDPGDMALWPGILVYVIAMLCTGFWEELVLRGVFLCNAADGLRRWLSPHRAVVGALTLSALVFALGHLGQTGVSVTMLTFVLSGVVLGIVYLYSGNLALVIGAHAAFNITSNVLFARADGVTDGLSAIMRIEVEPSLTVLRPGGLLEAAAFLLVALLGLLWLRHSRGSVSIDLPALGLPPDAAAPQARRSTAQPVETDVAADPLR
jgi:uncharacterized protein